MDPAFGPGGYRFSQRVGPLAARRPHDKLHLHILFGELA